MMICLDPLFSEAMSKSQHEMDIEKLRSLKDALNERLINDQEYDMVKNIIFLDQGAKLMEGAKLAETALVVLHIHMLLVCI